MPDRLAAVGASTAVSGIDFMGVGSADETALRVHSVNAVVVQGPLDATKPVTITGGESVATVPVLPISLADWGTDDQGRQVVTLHTPFAGDFSLYRLTINSSALDSYYASVAFTFKAGCPSNLDCAQAASCYQAPVDTAPTDSLAKAFASFRAALLDYSTRAYPNWVERDEPDIGIVLAEVLSAVGDDLSYLQDRIANESNLQTATQRNSVVKLARLVDYEARPATSARTVVQIDVNSAAVRAGIAVGAPQPDGDELEFELGDGLIDPTTGELLTGFLQVDPRWNRFEHTAVPAQPRILPYWWDDSKTCLPAGTTEMWVRGHGFAFPVGDPRLGTIGIALLIDTAASTPADPPVRHVAHLTAAIEENDALFGVPVTHLAWDPTEALTAEHDLTRAVLAGNLVPAVQGRRCVETFVIDPDQADSDAARAAVARSGPDAGCGDPIPIYLHTLGQGRLAWLTAAGGSTTPEIHVEMQPVNPADPPQLWRWRRSLLNADLFEAAYTVEPVNYRDVRVERSTGLPWFEYDGDGADSVRFGTGTFGERPSTGSSFDVTYRITAGRAGNVAADSVTVIPHPLTATILYATNPFAAAGGDDEETLDHVRATAPYAFRARQFRAVRVEDYDRTAEELAWVIDAGTAMRWTGSWLTVFTTAQAKAREQLTLDEHEQLIQLLGRRRIAGYEVYTPPPRFVGLDLLIDVCAEPSALRGEVEAAILDELGTGTLCDGRMAFFAPGQLRFGAPLERSKLEAAVQGAAGVAGVVEIKYRRRGYVPDYILMPELVTVGRDQIIRVDNDPSQPEHGPIRVVIEGGK